MQGLSSQGALFPVADQGRERAGLVPVSPSNLAHEKKWLVARTRQVIFRAYTTSPDSCILGIRPIVISRVVLRTGLPPRLIAPGSIEYYKVRIFSQTLSSQTMVRASLFDSEYVFRRAKVT